MADDNEPKINSQGAAPTDMDPGQSGSGPNPPPADEGGKPLKKGPSDTKKDDGTPKAPEKGKEPDGKTKDEAASADDEDEDEDDDGVDPRTVYIEFQDPAGQSVVELLKESGVKAIEANAMFQEAIDSGDLSKVRWDLLEARLGKAKTVLAKAGITEYYNSVYKQNEATRQSAFEAVGGEDNWKKLSKWVKKTERADPSQKETFDELRSMIDKGGRSAKSAIKELKEMYEGASGNSSLTGVDKLHRGDRTGKPVGSPLTRAEANKELKKAEARGASAQELEAIRVRRRAGRAQGI